VQGTKTVDVEEKQGESLILSPLSLGRGPKTCEAILRWPAVALYYVITPESGLMQSCPTVTFAHVTRRLNRRYDFRTDPWCRPLTGAQISCTTMVEILAGQRRFIVLRGLWITTTGVPCPSAGDGSLVNRTMLTDQGLSADRRIYLRYVVAAPGRSVDQTLTPRNRWHATVRPHESRASEFRPVLAGEPGILARDRGPAGTRISLSANPGNGQRRHSSSCLRAGFEAQQNSSPTAGRTKHRQW
jgi:hypothetical protein